MGGAVALALAFGLGTVVIVVRAIDLPLKKLVGAADRFGAGDLRPLDLGEMPTELGRLAQALDRMRTRLRGLVESVIGEARSISSNASDFSAMSEELAATSGEISTGWPVMVKPSRGRSSRGGSPSTATSSTGGLRPRSASRGGRSASPPATSHRHDSVRGRIA